MRSPEQLAVKEVLAFLEGESGDTVTHVTRLHLPFIASASLQMTNVPVRAISLILCARHRLYTLFTLHSYDPSGAIRPAAETYLTTTIGVAPASRTPRCQSTLSSGNSLTLPGTISTSDYPSITLSAYMPILMQHSACSLRSIGRHHYLRLP